MTAPAVANEAELACPMCGYDLRGLIEPRCPECGYAYNGRSGRSNLLPAIIFVTLPLLFILAIFGVVIWYIHHLGYF